MQHNYTQILKNKATSELAILSINCLDRTMAFRESLFQRSRCRDWWFKELCVSVKGCYRLSSIDGASKSCILTPDRNGTTVVTQQRPWCKPMFEHTISRLSHFWASSYLTFDHPTISLLIILLSHF